MGNYTQPTYEHAQLNLLFSTDLEDFGQLPVINIQGIDDPPEETEPTAMLTALGALGWNIVATLPLVIDGAPLVIHCILLTRIINR